MAQVCVFDVNETLLDVGALDPLFVRLFGEAEARKTWFTQMLQNAFVATITGRYYTFGELGVAALEMLAERQQVLLDEQGRQELREGMMHLPAHTEVPESLERLREGGMRIAALTNSTQVVAEAQLSNAGLRANFEQVFSADMVRRLKPAPEPYQMVAQQLGIRINEMLLIAAHSWDIAGALAAGCTAAFVGRPGMVLNPLGEKPEIIGANLYEVVTQILTQYPVP